MVELISITKVYGLGKVFELNGNFYETLRQFNEYGARLISPRDDAYARLQTRGKENIGLEAGTGTRTSAGFEYITGRPVLLTLESKLMNLELAKEATERSRLGDYFYTDSTKEYEESFEQAEKDKSKPPIERSVIILPEKRQFRISKRVNWEIYQAIFKDQAEPYFELNGPITIALFDTKSPFSRIHSQLTGTLLTNLDFLVKHSICGFNPLMLAHESRTRGVRLLKGKMLKFCHNKI